MQTFKSTCFGVAWPYTLAKIALAASRSPFRRRIRAIRTIFVRSGTCSGVAILTGLREEEKHDKL